MEREKQPVHKVQMTEGKRILFQSYWLLLCCWVLYYMTLKNCLVYCSLSM